MNADTADQQNNNAAHAAPAQKLRRSLWSWCLFDAGNSAFGTVIITFVFSVFFARSVVGDETAGMVWWGYAMAASGLLIAVLSPLVGAAIDHYGARKPGLLLFSLLCVVPTALLYFAVPDAPMAEVIAVLALVVLANAGFEIALVYANAMLPHIAPPHLVGRVSGWAWGLGYIGGLVCLALALFGFVGMGDNPPLLPLPDDHAQNIRAVAPMVALWYFIFTVPLLLWTHDVARTGLSLRVAIGRGLAQLRRSWQIARAHRNLSLYLAGSALYRDGLNTLFAMGGMYAASVYGMGFQDILIFAIGLNVTAALGAGVMAYADDHFGSRKVIMIALCGLIVTGAASLMVDDKGVFMGMALLLGFFIGPAQAASRTLVARLTPPDLVGHSYGIYNLTGRVASFFGPLCFALAVHMTGLQKAGMFTILLFWLAGMAFLFFVRENRAHEDS